MLSMGVMKRRKQPRISLQFIYGDVIKWQHFPRYWPFVRVDSPSQRSVTRSFDYFFLSAPEQTVKQTVETLLIWDAIALIMTAM